MEAAVAEMRILFAGGGTGGSVTPLLAVAELLRTSRPDIALLFVGTGSGPEQELVRQARLAFETLPAAKYRRYASWKNVTDVMRLAAACVAAWRLLRKLRPNVIVSAGSYVSVPVVWMGWLLRIPALIHQQDLEPGLANKLMVRFARRITVTFERSLRDFPGEKTVVTGNPLRSSLQQGSIASARQRFALDPTLPTLLVLGGGTGALRLNELFVEAVFHFIDDVNVIHVTGKGKATSHFEHPHYHMNEFLTDGLADALCAADLVISRAGLGTLTELAALGKAAVLVPLAHTHQVRNAEFYAAAGAALLLNETTLTPEILTHTIQDLLQDHERRTLLCQSIKLFSRPDATQRLTQEILSLLSHGHAGK